MNSLTISHISSTHTTYVQILHGVFSKFFFPKSAIVLVYMGLRFLLLSFPRSCPNVCSVCNRIIFLQRYLALVLHVACFFGLFFKQESESETQMCRVVNAAVK